MVGFSAIKLALGAALATSSVVAQSDAWHFDYVGKLLVARLDPIVDPNALSMHMHRIVGGSNFAAGYSYENQRASDCSTVYTPFDKSNYWTAQMYWVNNDANTVNDDTTYTAIPGGTRFYYFLTRNAPDIPVSPFPEGLRILAGNKDAKSWDETGLPDGALQYFCQRSRTDLQQNIVAKSWNDFDVYCPELKMELRFPSCWDGKHLYSDDGSHMAYPNNVLYGVCPLSHPIRLPAMMFEMTWELQDIANNQPPKNRVILANGDTTAFSTHVDFANGWDTSILSKALNDSRCVNLGRSIAAEDCPVFNIEYAPSRDVARECKPMRGELPEDGSVEGVAIKGLPGCNLPWASGPKPTCDKAPASPDISAFLGVTPQSYIATAADTVKVYKAKVLSHTSTEWQSVGCIAKNAFSEPTQWKNWNIMTVETCQDFCGSIGKPYSGLLLGYQCMCSAALDSSADVTVDATCNIACPGDKSKTCGGEGVLQIYYKPTVKVEPPSTSDNTYAGCYVDGSIAKTRSGDWLDVDGCRSYCKGQAGSKYFGVTKGKYCWCDSQINTPQGWQSRVPDLECNSKCEVNESQTCGGYTDNTMFQGVYLVDGEVEVPKETITASVPSLSAASSSFAAPTPVGAVKSDTAVAASASAGTSVAASSSNSAAASPTPVINNNLAVGEMGAITSSSVTATAPVSGDAETSAKVTPTENKTSLEVSAKPTGSRTCKRSRKRSQMKRHSNRRALRRKL